MAYIDSELAKRRSKGSSLATSTSPSDPHDGPEAARSSTDAALQRQPAALGKIQEIDLGPATTLRNIARTEAAARRLAGEEVIEETDESGRKTTKVRLGPDGKPWRGGRGRKRRTSEDIRRDKLVEDVLRESRRTRPSYPLTHVQLPG